MKIIIDNEDIQLVNDGDSWAQSNNKQIDSQLESIFVNAEGNSSGWEGIAHDDPESFKKAYDLLKPLAHNFKS